MKVGKLIELLQEFDPNIPIVNMGNEHFTEVANVKVSAVIAVKVKTGLFPYGHSDYEYSEFSAPVETMGCRIQIDKRGSR